MAPFNNRINTRGQDRSLSGQMRSILDNSQLFICVTNWFAGQWKASYETGHDRDLKFRELEVVVDRIAFAHHAGEPLDATIVIQDFELKSELIEARQLLRNDDKYSEKGLPAKLDFAAFEIATMLRALRDLSNDVSGSETVKFQVRATPGLIAHPTLCSDRGAVAGRYLSNLSDFFAPVQLFDVGTDEYNIERDHCEVFVDKSIQILGDRPAFRAERLMKLGMDRPRLSEFLCYRVKHDPINYPEYFEDSREFLGPEY